MEYLDPWTSRAFAVADHQIAHVYVANPADIPARARGDRRARRRRRGARGRVAGRRRARPRALRRARRAWPSATPGSPTTTGSTTPTPRTSAARSRSTASRATTPPSCSWTRTTRRAPSCAPATALARKKAGMRYVPERRRAGRVQVRQGHPRPAARADDLDAPVFLCSEASSREIAPRRAVRRLTDVARTCCLDLTRACARARPLARESCLTTPGRACTALCAGRPAPPRDYAGEARPGSRDPRPRARARAR